MDKTDLNPETFNKRRVEFTWQYSRHMFRKYRQNYISHLQDHKMPKML